MAVSLPRLIASDMDGTLLDPSQTVAEPTAKAVERAARHGIEVVVATGRSHWSALKLLDDVPSIRWLLCSNGATLYDRTAGEVAATRAIASDVVEASRAAVAEHFPTAAIAYETPEGIFYPQAFVENRVAANPSVVVKDNVPEPDSIDGQPILKLMVSHPQLVQLEWLDALVPIMPSGLQLSTSGADFIEVCAPTADKGLALADLCASLGVDAADVAAFGDHSNDLGMLTWAGQGYAMANGVDRTKAVTDLRAPHHAEHGVAQVIDGLLDDAGLD